MTVASDRVDRSGIVSAAFLDRTADGVFVVDRAWNYVFVNAAGAAIVGLSPAELVGRNLWTMFPEAVGSRFEREARRAMRQREPVELEQYVESRDQWNAIRIFPSAEGMTLYFEDVSRRRRSERTAERLATIVEASDDAVVSQDMNGVVLTWNAAAERIFGYSSDEIVGTPIIKLTEPELVDERNALIRRVHAGERVDHQITRRLRKDGSVVEVSLSVFPVHDDDGAVVGTASIARDITAERSAEQVLVEAQRQHLEEFEREAGIARDAEARLRRVLDGMAEGVAETTLDGRIVMVNEAFGRMVGYSSAEEVMTKVTDVTALYADPAKRTEFIDAALRADGLSRADAELVARDGHHVWVRAKFRPTRDDDDGEVTGMHIIAEDVSATRAAEAQAREAEERLHFAFQDNPMPLLVVEFTDAGSIVSSANTALERMLGYGPGELVGADVDRFVHPDDVEAERANGPHEGEGHARATFESRRRHRDGHWIPVSITAVTLESATGRWYAIAAMEDITARRAAQEELLKALRQVEFRARAERALADLAQLTLEATEFESLGRSACGLVARILAVDFCSILLPAEDGSGLEISAEWGWDRRILATVDTEQGSDSQASYAARHGRPVIVDDWHTETRFTRSPLQAAHDARSGLSVAIRHDQSTIGVVGVQTRTLRRFDDAAVTFLESAAKLVGIGLRQQRVMRSLTESRQTLQAIVDNAPVAIHVLDPDGRFLIVNRELERIIGMPRDLLMGRMRSDIPRLAPGAPLAELVDGIGALRHRTPIALEHTTTEPDGIHSYLSVDFPLLDAAGNAYGVGGISTDVTELVHSRAETRAAWLESMGRLARAVEYRDDDTGKHIERMAAYADLIARALGLSDERCAQIRAAAAMHDLGKIATPDRVLLKRGRLTDDERTIMQAHPEVGYRLLAGSGSQQLELAATIAYTHHEWFDGSGYPRGLAGDAIPIEGRIVAIAASFDALTADRVYRKAMPIDDAVELMRADRGHFDPEVLEHFLGRLDQVKRVWATYRRQGSAGASETVAGGDPVTST